LPDSLVTAHILRGKSGLLGNMMTDNIRQR